MGFKRGNKSGQLTIFIIIAIIIVAVVLGIYIFKNNSGASKVPRSFEPVYNNFLNCLEDDLDMGILAIETQGGYITLPDFEPGSGAFPFSSQLNFVGSSIPYWYYVSDSGVQKTQVPTVEDMEKDIEGFVSSRINDCTFDSYYDEGFELLLGSPEPKVTIKDGEVNLDLNMDFVASKEDERVVIQEHKVTVNSDLGNLYKDALKVYGKEQEDLFLEDYGMDTLNLYAPVDGVDFICSPEIWFADKVFGDLEEAIELNTMALKIGSDKDYSSIDLNTENNVRFISSRNWPRSFEVNPTDGNVLRADPVGNQPGMGILGFCYVSYHFVYNINYPVLVQISSENSGEVFQFPMAVVIQGNQPREPLSGNAVGLDKGIDLCADLNSFTTVSVFDKEGNPVEANVSYDCLSEKCNVGETAGGVLSDYFPQCVNGFILTNAEGYKDGSFMYSTVNSGQVSVFLDRVYPINVNLYIDGKSYNKNAIINFVSEDEIKSVYYPEQNQVELSEGDYNIQVYVYEDTDLKIPETTVQQCYDVPRGPLLGAIGFTKKECVDVNYSEQVVTNALAAGGSSDYSISESQLKNFDSLDLNVERLPAPESISQLQNNYILFDNHDVEVKFK